MAKVVKLDATQVFNNKGLSNGGSVHKAFNNGLLRSSRPYTPFDTGALDKSGRVEDKGVSWNTPYAKHLYLRGGSYRFKGAPMRGANWAHRSFSANKEELLKEAVEVGMK